MLSPVEEKFTESLISCGKLQRGQLDRAVRLQQESNGRLETLLVHLGFIAERDIAAALANALELPEATSDDYAQIVELDGRVTLEFLVHSLAVPVREDEEVVDVVMADPRDAFVLQGLELALAKPVRPLVGIEADILQALERLKRRDPDAVAESVEEGGAAPDVSADDIEHLRDMASEAPVIRTVNQLVMRALDLHASDIHIEPFEGTLTVRYRIDGILRRAETLPAHLAPAVVSRVKVMAHLNIAERRLPQDGRIKQRIEGREVDMRISIVPTLYGESVVIRLLDPGGAALELAALGFGGELLDRLQKLLSQPQGILLVTGPTGSGKTTTLYAALTQINTVEKKIITVEDPVEYRLEGINQIQVQTNIDLTFANALRSILRQDPDVLMIGEMRDGETARIAVQSALTGHLVFSTLHTNDAAGSITRLLDMRVEDFLVTSTVNGVLAQRLVRRLCKHCPTSWVPGRSVMEETGLAALVGNAAPTLYRAAGCEHCEGSGYSGRTTIAELLVMSENIRQAVIAHADAGTIQAAAVAGGMRTMREDGLRKALAGETTLEEVERVTRTHVESG